MEKHNSLVSNDTWEVKLFNEVIRNSQITTLAQVAIITDINVSQLYDWSAGKKKPKASTVLKIAEKIGVEVEFPKVRKVKAEKRK